MGGALGTAIARYDLGFVDWRAWAIAQATIVSFHLMTHYANDYFDRAADARSMRTPYSGGSGALIDGSLAPRVALVAAIACAVCGIIASAALATVAHAPLAAALGLGIGALAWAYSAPPLRLLARGLGEAATALVVAVLVPLCAFAAQQPPLERAGSALASTLPAAAAMFAMMLAVEFPDLLSDATGGKRNLVVRAGPRRARRFGLVAIGAAVVAVIVAIVAGAPPALALFEALAVPPALGLARAFAARSSADPTADEALAARGVALFFLVSFDALLAYAAAP